jgi:hypothetical protein
MSPWLAAFVFTQLVECPLYLVALRRQRDRPAVKLAIAFGASALTHPIVWSLIPTLYERWLEPALAGGLRHFAPGASPAQLSYAGLLLVAESFAVVAEALYLRLFGLRRAGLWALVANAASVTLGLLSRAAFGWP